MKCNYYEISESQLKSTSFKAGSIYFTTDSGKLYFDPIGGGVRRLIGGDFESYISAISDIIIPDYYKSHLDIKISEISSILNSIGGNYSVFLWYTDAHWANNYGSSPSLLKYVSKNTSINKTFYGGDISVNNTGDIGIITKYQEMISDIPNHHSVIGNHDNQVTELATVEDLANFFIMKNRTSDMITGTDPINGKMYYYIDNGIEKTRYICLSTGRMWTNDDEVEWFVNVLNTTPDNWHIIVISHLWLNNDYDNGGIIKTPELYTQVYLDLFDAYNYRESGTTEMHSISYDFTESKAKIEFAIGGHTHCDYDFSTNRGVPIILTECDSWEIRDTSSSAEQGSITENCIYTVIADYSTNTVNIINIGRGNTRSLALPNIVTYTNVLRNAIDETGSIYNGIGYKPNVRINSSNVETTATGWYLTGYIPCKIHDIIYFKNLEYMDISGDGGNTSRTEFTLFDTEFIEIGSASHSMTQLPGDSLYPVYGENGDMIQMRVPNWGEVAYIRFCCRYLDNNSIITINEPIE